MTRRSARVLALLLTLLMAVVGAALPGGAQAAPPAPAPVVTGVGSGVGPLAPSTVVVRGRNLKRADRVVFGSRAARILARAAGQVTVRTPRGARPGTVAVRVHTPAGWSTVNRAARYTFLRAPSLTRVSPATGPWTGGQRVTLTGKDLSRTSSVRFGDQRARVLRRTATSLVVTTPVGVRGAAPVRATSPGGTSRASTYTYGDVAAAESSVVQTLDGTYTATTVQWVTGGPRGTTTAAPWEVGLPAGADVPTTDQPFVVPPGTSAFPSGLAGTVAGVAVQPDDSTRVTVQPSDLESTYQRLSLGYSGPVDLASASGRAHRREVAGSVQWPINGSSLLCRDQEGNSVSIGASLSMVVTDVDVSQHVDLGGFFSKPTYDAALTAEVQTTGKVFGEVASTCSTSDAWELAHRRVVPLGTTGLTVSFAPTFEFSLSAQGSFSMTDRTRTTFAVDVKLGDAPRFTRTSRTVESKMGGALSFAVGVAGGVSVQFGLLDRAGVEGKLLLGVAATLEARNDNVCVSAKLQLKLSVGLFLDAIVFRWESPTLNATIDLYQFFERCVLADDPPTDPTEPRIITTRLPDAEVDSPYSGYLETADGREGTWSVLRGPLPPGLSLDPATGEIYGTPTGGVADYPVVVDFTGTDGQVATTTVRLQVLPSHGIGGGDVQVTLQWTGPADLDLHVVDPDGEEIYYTNPSSLSGGQLDKDANAGCNGPADDDNAVENIYWPPKGAPQGSYAASVVVYDVCDGPLDWHLTIRRNGVVVFDQNGNGDSGAVPFSVGTPTKPRAAAASRFAGVYPPK